MKFHPNGREKKLIPLSDRANSTPFLAYRNGVDDNAASRGSIDRRVFLPLFFFRKTVDARSIEKKRRRSIFESVFSSFSLDWSNWSYWNSISLFEETATTISYINWNISFKWISNCSVYFLIPLNFFWKLDKLYTKSSLNYSLNSSWNRKFQYIVSLSYKNYLSWIIKKKKRNVRKNTKKDFNFGTTWLIRKNEIGDRIYAAKKKPGGGGETLSPLSRQSQKTLGEVESFRLSRQPNFDDFNHEIFPSLPSPRLHPGHGSLSLSLNY